MVVKNRNATRVIWSITSSMLENINYQSMENKHFVDMVCVVYQKKFLKRP